jgi:hypothetical protein
MKAALVVAIAAMIACGGSQKKGGGRSGSASGSSAGSELGSGSASGSAVASGADTSPLTRDECAAMLGHILDIAAAEAKGNLAPQGDEQVAERKKLVDEQAEACMQQIPRAQYTCAMAAKTSADLKPCAQ